MQDQIQQILKLVKPSPEEEKKAWEIINEFVSLLSKFFDDIIVGGSFGKGTWLKGTSDVDIFIRFPKDDRNLSDKIQDALNKLNLKYIRIHGSRDYFKVFFNGLEFEIVPILKITSPEEARNVTDLSPFHVQYVKSKIAENPKLADEIRITKAFFKAIGVYGAESYINGFSGYACEVLTIYYKSFLELLKAAVHWKPKVIIDPENLFKDKKEIFKTINKDRLRSPIIVIDPVSKIRNITASVSMKAFATLIFFSKKALFERDILSVFNKQEFSLEDAIEKSKKLGTTLLYIEALPKSENLDVSNTKFLKLLEFINKQLNILGFIVLDYDIKFFEEFNTKGEVFIYVYPSELPKYGIRLGPPVWVNSVEDFYKKWKNYQIKINKSGRVIAIVPRKIRTLKEAINYLLENYKTAIDDKVREIRFKIY